MRSCVALATLMLTGWFGGAAALAQPAKTSRAVADDIGLFSADAEAKANQAIERIKQLHKKDFVVEATHAPKRPGNLDKNDKAAVGRFFDEWAAARFKNQQINGVYVVILDDPKIIRVVVGPETLKKGTFTTANRDELFQKIQAKLKASDEDGALLAAVNYVADTMQKNAGATVATTPAKKTGAEESDGAGPTTTQTPAPQAPVQASPIIKWILIGLAILLVFWLVSAVIRGFSSMGSGAGAGGAGGHGGGGGFLTGMLGGLFGAAAGMWMYNHFFGGGGPSAYAGPTSTGYTPNEPTDVGAGEPSVGGGSYDNADHGVEPTDAGGWDTGGGGDWGGGGDVGGGGGDWGGGGGGGDW